MSSMWVRVISLGSVLDDVQAYSQNPLLRAPSVPTGFEHACIQADGVGAHAIPTVPDLRLLEIHLSPYCCYYRLDP